jgi:hypothetical protein
MELWHPRAQRVEPADGHTGLSFDGVPWKIVLHTTETDSYSPNRSSYYGNPYWPAATITAGTIYQHLPINVGQYALYSDGSVATNHANAVQCEIVWRAANGDWPDALLSTLADWVTWVQSQTGVPTVFAEMFREGTVVASVDSPLRFGNQEWLDFNGICFAAGTLVTTQTGQMPIEEVTVGTKVLTHAGRWRPVTGTSRRVAETVEVKGHGHPGLTTTAEHPFLSTASRLVRQNHTPTRWRALAFDDPTWVPAADLPGRYWATPAVFPISEVPDVTHLEGKGRRIKVQVTPDLLRLAGRWVADGHMGDNGRLHISAHTDELEDVVSLIFAAGFVPQSPRVTSDNCAQVAFSSVAFKGWMLAHFGQHAHAKTIPSWLLGCDIKYREMFLLGYLDGDGHWESEQRFDAKTVSKSLAIGLRLLATSLGYTTSVYLLPAGVGIFPGGRSCHTRAQWRVKGDSGSARATSAIIGDHLFTRAKQATPGATVPVFNLSVAEDESYVADGFVVHNCGHSNVPGGNDHWDPGRLPVDRLRALLGGPVDPPIPTDPLDLNGRTALAFLGE